MNDHKKLERQQWRQVMHLVHKCEIKYGSIAKTPKDDPNFVTIRKLCKPRSDFKDLTFDMQTRIINSINDGRTKSYVINAYGASSELIDQVVSRFGLTFKPTWKYILRKPGEPAYFVKSKLQDIPVIFNRKFSNSKVLQSYLFNNDYELIVKKTIWCNVPIGSFYVTANRKLFRKTDDEYRE